MKLEFEITLPRATGSRILLDIPVNLEEHFGDKISEKANVTINGKSYVCRLFENGNGFYAFHLIKAIQKDVAPGVSVKVSLEFPEEKQSNIHEEVLKWETNDAVNLMIHVGIKKFDNIIDFGCGHGHYTIPCAICMENTGTVYAIDKSNTGLKWVKQKLDMFQLRNVNIMKTNGNLIMDFPAESIDVVLLYDLIHIGIDHKNTQKSDPIRYLLYKEAHRVLKKDGILSILSFNSEMKAVPFENVGRRNTSYSEIMSEIPDYGFSFSHLVDNGLHFDWYHSNYQLNKGLNFQELEKGVIYNFTKVDL